MTIRPRLSISDPGFLAIDIRRVSWNLYTWRIIIGEKWSIGRSSRKNMKLATSDFMLKNGGVATAIIPDDRSPGGRTVE